MATGSANPHVLHRNLAKPHWDEELALRHVVREYVRFWHVHICKKPEGDLDDYWPLLTRRAVEPPTAHSFYATPFITNIFLVRNRAGQPDFAGDMIHGGGGNLWVDTPSHSSRTVPIKSEMGGPFPLILHDVDPPRSAEKSYTAWGNGQFSASGRSWEIDSDAVGGEAGVRLRGNLDHVTWHYDLGTAYGFEHASNPSLGRERVLEQAPKFATSHTLKIWHGKQAAEVEIVFDYPPHHVQARHAGDAFHVLGKSSTRRRD
ncbi:hypothetical protein RTBOTA2_004205 [Rhodotorula toruloides]|uniref:Uncharacterized protein n=1 Tax=Rhodotorula toruloides TaxID=5286 RepID=A0A2T0A0J7_RHOTO|nr:hypothetical protein RTBOTA2_004205 [Rhodotorula toruloides]PRQ71548.1 hypothetical protein AAT19DRAFT_10406 [Rhodotorula toruloides]